MQHIQAHMVADVINELGDQFDAHAVEKRLLRRYTAATAREILRYENSGDVLTVFSREIALYVDRTFQGQIRQTPTKVDSENLGGKESKNTQWVRLIAPVVAPTPETDGAETEEVNPEDAEDDRLREAIHAVALRNAAGRMDEEP